MAGPTSSEQERSYARNLQQSRQSRDPGQLNPALSAMANAANAAARPQQPAAKPAGQEQGNPAARDAAGRTARSERTARAADQEAGSERRGRFRQLTSFGRRFGSGAGEQVFGSAGELLQTVLGQRGKQIIYGLLLVPPIFTPLISPQTFLFRPFLLFAVDAYWWSTSHSSILRPLAMWEKVVIALAHFFYLIDILVFGIILYTLTHPCFLLDFVDLGVFNFLRGLIERTCSPELIEKFLKVAT